MDYPLQGMIQALSPAPQAGLGRGGRKHPGDAAAARARRRDGGGQSLAIHRRTDAPLGGAEVARTLAKVPNLRQGY